MSFPYAKMSTTQIEEFLNGRRLAVVGTNREIGPPQLSLVWYFYENGLAYIYFAKKSVKHRNLLRDPQIALCIAGNYPDSRSVKIYGTVELVPDSTDVDQIGWRLTRRYFDSDDEARDYINSYHEESVVAIIKPSKIIGEDYN